jgi:hypothetical protein
MRTRAALIQAHQDRYKDAQALFKAERWGGATYIAGYVIECILKAKILKNLNSADLPRDYWHHDLERLLQVSGLDRKMSEPQNRWIRDKMLLIQFKWKITMRYGSLQLIDRHMAGRFMKAVEEVKGWVRETIQNPTR